MTGTWGVYRRKTGLDIKKKPEGNNVPTFKDPAKRAEFDAFVGSPYFDHPGVVLSQNADGTANVRIYGDPNRDVFESKIIRNVPVTSTLSIGSFVPNTVAVHTTVSETPSEGGDS